MIIFEQEEDQDVRESGDFSKFRLSEETVEALKGWLLVLFMSFNL